jgi:hypothetical protein
VALGTDARSALQMLWTTWGQLLSSTSPCLSGRTGPRKSRRRRPLVQPKLPDHELRLLGACGKERTGFPQADAAQLSEIPHPVDPEIWKRYYTVMLRCAVRMFEFAWCHLYWLGACTLTPSASGRGV